MNIDFNQVINLADRELEQKKLLEREWRNLELARADIQLLKVEDGIKGIGTQKAWREYRNALRDYPSSEDFPRKRPTAPDNN